MKPMLSEMCSTCSFTCRRYSLSAIRYGKDLYKILGVSSTATQDEIRKAFLQKSKQLHPDMNPHVDTHNKFVELQEAYQTLGTSARRHEYDRRTQSHPGFTVHQHKPPHMHQPHQASRASNASYHQQYAHRDYWYDYQHQSHWRRHSSAHKPVTSAIYQGLVICMVILWGSGVLVYLLITHRLNLRQQQLSDPNNTPYGMIGYAGGHGRRYYMYPYSRPTEVKDNTHATQQQLSQLPSSSRDLD